MKIQIYTDGSCIGNPGPGGWAFVILDQDEEILHQASGSSLDTTNNRMEMQAIIEALKYVHKNHSSATFELHSDSNLLVQSINLGWKRKANLDLWMDMDKALANVKVKFKWVKAHHQNAFNNLCDELAQAASRKALKKLNKSPASAKTLIKKAPPKSNRVEQSSIF